MRLKKPETSESLMIRLARVAGSVAGTLAAKTAKVVARTESSAREGGSKDSKRSGAASKPSRARAKKKSKPAGQNQKRKRNRNRSGAV
jgi:hypothetical protein